MKTFLDTANKVTKQKLDGVGLFDDLDYTPDVFKDFWSLIKDKVESEKDNW